MLSVPCKSSETGPQTEVIHKKTCTQTHTVCHNRFKRLSIVPLFMGIYYPLQAPVSYYNVVSSSCLILGMNERVNFFFIQLQFSNSFYRIQFCSALKCCAFFLGALVFQLKKRPPDYQGRKGRKVDDKGMKGNSLPPEKLPYLVELSPGKILLTHLHR